MEFKGLGKFYKGQAYNVVSYPGREASYYDLTRVHEILKSSLGYFSKKFNTALYLHKGESIASLIENKKDIVLGIERESGRDYVCLLSAILNMISGYKTIFLVPDKNRVLRYEKKFEEDLQKANLYFEVGGAPDKESFIGYLNTLTPDLLITTPEIIYECLTDIKSSYSKGYFISELGLVILEEFLDFDLRNLLQLKYLISVLRSLSSQNLRFIFTTYFSGDIKNLVTFLVGKSPDEIEVITMDTASKNSFNVIFWMPEIILNEKGSELIASRKEYIEEVISLVSGLVSKLNRENILILHAFAPISSFGIQRIREKISASITKTETAFSISVVSDPEDITKPSSNFDTIILLGLPRDVKRLRNFIGNLIDKDGDCIVVMPEDPFSYYISRQENIESLVEQFPVLFGPLLLSTEFLKPVQDNYFKLFLFHTQNLYLDIKKFEEIWGKADEFIKSYQSFLKLRDDKVRITNQSILQKSLNPFPWGSFSQNDIVFYLEDKPFLSVDREAYPFLFFEGQIVYLKGEKFIIEEVKPEQKTGKMRLSSPVDPAVRIPIIQFGGLKFETEKTKQMKNHPLHISISVGEIEFSSKLLGYKQYIDYNLSGREASTVALSPQATRNVKTRCLQISARADILHSCVVSLCHEIEHILKIFIPVYFPEIYRNIFIFCDSDSYSVYIIPTACYISETIDILYTQIDKILEEDFLIRFLTSCPCEHGCPLCLKIINCIADPQEDVRKRDLLIALARNSIDCRFLLRGLECKDARTEYQKVRAKVLELFKNHLEIEIKNPVPLECVKSLGKGILGSFYPEEKIIRVIENLKRKDAIEVIGHEYAHNYEDENGVFTPEKLIIEGFAQWVAFKIMFFYGLIENMKAIKLREYDEYGAGFNLLYWLEQKVGFYEVIEFVKSGKAKEPESHEEYDLPRIEREMGKILPRQPVK